ncbi:hypothetical protein SAMN05444166_5572 [Singulisphaera sp. GP187]|uniref:hypothetical protein n=1 Tax=Singulisphaera sp. GP187 TaxID=1882752 RepID=UPI00092A3890|nr:hypothetical protein [Singulisphaera sp. GP187]SIO58129.1 hypothetical protein SAMN05444166_5572 [Singulisphaera sp. GP187]
MRGRVIRLVAMVGVAFTVCTPAFVAAQVRKEERVEIAPVQAVIVEKKAAVAREAEVRIQLAAPMIINGALNGNGMVDQWTRQFRPILRVEYLFMRGICDPSKDTRLPIARAGLQALDEAAKKYVDWQKNQNMVVAGRLVERPAIPDTRQFIQEALAAAVKAQLSPSQYERYRAELDARSVEQKRVAILNLVAKLDRVLVLSPEQRDQISESLSSHWEDVSAQGFQSFNLDDQYLPMISDALVANFLNAAQKTIWIGIQKVTFGSNGIGIGMHMQDGPLDDEFADEVAKEAVKPGTEK